MKTPDIPHDETMRLRALHSLQILDSPAEARFDRLTRLAQRIFDVPIALISLVDDNRQWFKSHAGLATSETPREISFCGHAILSDDAFIIEDATKDKRFADNPLVPNNPFIRFYAGRPLRHVDGSKLGTLCLIDPTPRTFSDDDIGALNDLAGLVESELAATHLATLDDLTKIMNRRGFITFAEQSLHICLRQELSASLVFFDLNNFKEVNDRFGHAEGDNALVAFAQQMNSTFRDSDIVARFGGDEFVVLLTDAPAALTVETIERFRYSLDAHNKTASRGYDISFSSGIVTVKPGQDYSIHALLSKADTLMYAGKRKRAPIHTER